MITVAQANRIAPLLEPLGMDETRRCLPEEWLRELGLQESVFDDHPWYEGKEIDPKGRNVHVIQLEGFQKYLSGYVSHVEEVQGMQRKLEAGG